MLHQYVQTLHQLWQKCIQGISTNKLAQFFCIQKGEDARVSTFKEGLLGMLFEHVSKKATQHYKQLTRWK